MSETASGVVGWVGSKKFGKKNLWSFKFDGEEDFFRTGETDPNLKQGDVISFDWSVNNNGYKVVDVSSIEKSQAAKPEVKAQGGSATAKAAIGYDQKQRVISYQAATNSAIAIAKIAVENDMLKLGAQNKKLENFNQVVTEIADELVVQYMNAPEYIEGLLEASSILEEPQVNVAAEDGVSDD